MRCIARGHVLAAPTLVDVGILTRTDDPTHKQKGIYSLTEMGIALLPVLGQMAFFGRKYFPVTPELAIRARLLEEGGPKLWDEFAQELRELHLGAPAKKREPGESVRERLQAAYEREIVKRKAG